ncbi:MAG TPA: amidohydrolase family protein [Terracidiphilus sp.]|nr:amidohydrolase family protein [Terracidiphilus sp.]
MKTAILASGLILAAAQASVFAQAALPVPNGASLAPAKTIAIVGGKLLTVTHGVIENGVVIMSGGKITAVGPASSTEVPADAEVFDAKGMTVYPGLFDAETHLGLTEVASDQNSNDLAETSDEISPQMHVADAFHAETVRIPVERLNGITNAIVAPASQDSVVGQDAAIQLSGRDRDEMLLQRDIALAMNFEGSVRRRANFEGPSKFPTTRMGLASQIRQAFLDAEAYEAERAAAAKPDHKGAPPKHDLKLEALLPYLHGEKPVVLGAYESYEVEVAMGIAKEFHLKVILNHVTHAQDILDEIASYHVPVIVGSIYDFPRSNERYDAVFSLPSELQKRGVKIALAGGDMGGSRNLPYAAGYAVAYGLPYDEALKAITLNPAEMFGLGDKLGSLDIGKTANVVVANGDPLDVRTSVKQVFVDGKAVPMVSRQTELRDQYMPLTKSK